MTTKAAGYEVENLRWTTIFATLSLDLAAPFVMRMGLWLPDDFRAGLRTLIEDFRRRDADPQTEASFCPTVLEWCAQEYGRNYTDYLYAWGRDVFQCGGGGAGVFLWSNVVRHKEHGGQESPPPFVVRLRESLSQIPKISVNKLTPTTEWDKVVYQRLDYDQFNNAMELVQATINYHDFVQAWAVARNTLAGKADLAILKTWGLSVARRMGMPVERLGEPGAWPDPPLVPVT